MQPHTTRDAAHWIRFEAFFSSLKNELADRFESCGAAKTELFDYIEVFYNQRRRHSTIGYRSPPTFERETRRPRIVDADPRDVHWGDASP